MTVTYRVLLGAALCTFSVWVSAQSLHVENPWSRAMPPTAPAAAAYFELHNTGAQADRLVGARTPIAGKAEVHEHAHVDGVMKMREVAGGVPVAADERVSFRPGGYHVMFFELPRQLAEGEQFPLTLLFEQAGEVTVQVPVLRTAPAGQNMHHHH
ncbi:MAG TPA: copper chaperone PCu(A)C [Pseudomonas sp.]|jgi:copper(I)-binding protein|nr:copper chaperone PCu(A)C [Pseudomonas sp.]